MSYPKTLAAISAFEGSAWVVADALVAEVAVNENGNVKQGEWPRVQKYLAANGYEVNADWLKHLHGVAKWASANRALEATIRGYSPRSVMTARTNAKGDHEFALEILAKHGGKLHSIAGSDPLGDVRKLTAEQVESVVEKLATHRPKALAKGVHNPKVLREVASDEETMEALDRRRYEEAEAKFQETHTGATAGGALGSSELQEKLRKENASAEEYFAALKAIALLAEMNVENVTTRLADREAIRHDLAAINQAIENLSTVRDRLTAEALSRREESV